MPKIPEGARVMAVLYEKPTDEPDAVSFGLTTADGVVLIEALSGVAALLHATLDRWRLALQHERERNEEALDDAGQGSTPEG